MLLALVLLAAVGCGPATDKPITAAEVERQIVHLTTGSSFARADAAKMLGASGSERAVEPLSAALKDDSPRVRAAAAKALGDLRDIRALWPLTLAAATDTDAKVRDAAAEAVTWLGPDPDSEVHRMSRKVLLERMPQFDFEDQPFGDMAMALCSYAHTSLRGGGSDGDFTRKKVTVHARNATIAELWCRGLVGTGSRVSFVIHEPIQIGSVSRLTELVQKGKWLIAWTARRRAHAARTVEGQEVLRKLATSVREAVDEPVALSDMLTYAADLSGAKIEVDWPALKAIGIGQDASVLTGGHKTLWRLLEGIADEASSSSYGKGYVDFYVEGSKVIVTTRSAVEARVGKVPTTATESQEE